MDGHRRVRPRLCFRGTEKYATQMDPENKTRISFFIKPDENMKDIKYKPNGMKC